MMGRDLSVTSFHFSLLRQKREYKVLDQITKGDYGNLWIFVKQHNAQTNSFDPFTPTH